MKPFPLRALKAWNDGRWTPHVAAFGGGGSTQTIQKSDPWSGQQPSLNDIYAQANHLYYNNVPQYFQGPTYAGLQPGQTAAQTQLEQLGQAGGTPGLQAAQNTMSSFLSPNYTNDTSGAFNQGQGVLANELSPGFLNPWNMPSFQQVVNNTLANVIPAATSSFTNGNRTGSGLATRAAMMAGTDAVGNLAQTQFQKNQDIQSTAQQQAASEYLAQQGNQLKAGSLAPLIDQTQLGDMNAGLQAAGMTQTDMQNAINAELQRWNYGQMLPWNQLQNYESAITGTGSPGGTTTTQQPYYSNTAANVMSGIGTAATVAMLAGSLFSDARLKTDIQKIGETDSGFPLYRYRYIDEGPMSQHIGVMAQDVVKKRPEAVSYAPFGFMMVNYEKALAT